MELSEEEIEDIIVDEITVDCYSDEEVEMGWAIFLTDNITYPFEAEYNVCKKDKTTVWEKVKVIGNETTDSSFRGESFYVKVELGDLIIPVEVLKLRNIIADNQTLRTIQVCAYENRHS